MDEGHRTRSLLNPDAGERFVSLSYVLGVTSFGINQMVLEPRQRGRIHRHARQEEVYLVLEGTLTLLVEGEEQSLQRGELGAASRRRSAASSSTAGPSASCCSRWAVTGEHAGRDGEAWTDWDSPLQRSRRRRSRCPTTCRPSSRATVSGGRLVQPEGRALVVAAELEAPLALPATPRRPRRPRPPRRRRARARARMAASMSSTAKKTYGAEPASPPWIPPRPAGVWIMKPLPEGPGSKRHPKSAS